jgi:hypothetical protein
MVCLEQNSSAQFSRMGNFGKAGGNDSGIDRVLDSTVIVKEIISDLGGASYPRIGLKGKRYQNVRETHLKVIQTNAMHNRPLHSVTPGYSHGWRCTAIGVHGGGCAPAESRQIDRWSWSSLASAKTLSGYYRVEMLRLFQRYRIGSR